MPELPEVESAAVIARAAAVGKTLAALRALHPSQARGLPSESANAVVGDTVTAIERRGKHQLIRLSSGQVLHVHFRMTGDWLVTAAGERIDPLVRVVLEFTDGTTLGLHDSRALSSVRLHAAGENPLPALGPEATGASFDAAYLRTALAGRRGAIKVALLDQRVVAGLGNIYAAEALWVAALDPRIRASSLGVVRLTRLVAGIRRTLAKAMRTTGRYVDRGTSARFHVYDRAGQPCRRCARSIRRITQGARSTYFCPGCQKR